MAPRDKLTRWLDVIAALLRRRIPASFDELRLDVPDYAVKPNRAEDSVARTFERDKDELRALGIAIETITDETGGDSRYRLRAEAFYLPYLSLCESTLPNGVALRPAAVPDGIGFKGLRVFPITPDERELLRQAAARVRSLGNAVLEHDAASALRKLEFDLGMLPDAAPIRTRHAVDGNVFEALGAALQRRKRVTMQYRSMGRDAIAERVVEPYGLVFTTGHWYLVARDPAVDSMRQFRVNRITAPQINNKQPAQPDYDIPATFDLSAHAESRQAWELGDGDADRVQVRFRGRSGHVQQALRLAMAADSTVPTPAPDAAVQKVAPGHAAAVEQAEDAELESVRVFNVRRLDPFLRWLLTFAGDAHPVAPDSAVAAWRDIVNATRAAQTVAFEIPSDIPLDHPNSAAMEIEA